jgi:Rieske Fe-S protein
VFIRLLHQAENKFKCPCHGSQYDSTGKKIRGPAPLVSASNVQQQDHKPQNTAKAAAFCLCYTMLRMQLQSLCTL